MGIVNNFRSLNSIQKYSPNSDKVRNIYKKYDEPTYLTFRLEFGTRKYLNDVSEFTSFDYMPHPLFQKPNGTTDEYLYSAYNYLININEPKRADMLLEFIDVFNIIQYDYQWYFQSITGIDKLLKVNTKTGKRISNETILEISCLDSLDRRMYHMFNLYKKIAWDDTYQRWILPDMMRFFTLDIYISEFRTFHKPFNTVTNTFVENVLEEEVVNSQKKNFLNSVITDISNAGVGLVQNTFRTYSQNLFAYSPILLKMMDSTLPTHVIKCHMCEFDIESFKSEQYNEMSVANEPIQVKFSFNVKVGNIEEEFVCPIFKRFYSDVIINGINRIYEASDDYNEKNFIEWNSVYNGNAYVPLSKRAHMSGDYYFETKASYDDPLNTSYTKKWIKDNMYLSNTNILNRAVNNLTTFGVAVIDNKIEQTIDKLKMAEFKPGLSFNSLQSSIASADILGTLALVRSSIKNTYESSLSKATNNELEAMTDETFNALLSEYSKATVNNDERGIQDAVKKALLDSAYYEQIKDYSRATDMLAKGEINMYDNAIDTSGYVGTNNMFYSTERKIENSLENYQNNTTVSKATNNGVVFEGNPTK